MTPLILAALLTAEPTVLSAPASLSEGPHVEVFTVPLSSVAMLGAGAFGGTPSWVYVPLGATVQLGESWGLTGELAVSHSVPRGFTTDGWSLSTSLGPTFFLSGRGMAWFFVAPKLTFQIGEAARNIVVFESSSSGAPLEFGLGISRSFLIGADAGYQFRWGHLTLALLLGASFGYAYDQAGGGLTSPFDGGNTSFGAPRRTQTWAYALNLNFLRLGYAF